MLCVLLSLLCFGRIVVKRCAQMYNLWSEEAPDDEGEATQDEDEEAMVVDED